MQCFLTPLKRDVIWDGEGVEARGGGGGGGGGGGDPREPLIEMPVSSCTW